MAAPLDIHLIDDTAGAQALTTRLKGVERIGLDTEFHAENRYQPEAMLIQIAVSTDEVWVVDARGRELFWLAEALANTEAIVHGGQHDVEILQRITGGLPKRVFDTQRAAAFCGFRYPIALAQLAGRVLGEHMDKTVALSNWATRPLTEQQLQYAAEDAVILLILAEELERRLEERGSLSWAWKASEEMVAEGLAEPSAPTGWLGWEVVALMGEEERRILRALFNWRVHVGQERDQPPHAVLSNGLALDLARRRPGSVRELTANRRFPRGLAKRHGVDLINILASALAETCPPPIPPDPKERSVILTLELWARALSVKTGIAPNLAMPSELALSVARQGPSACTGWRAEALGTELEQFTSGDVALTLQGQQLVIRDVGIGESELT